MVRASVTLVLLFVGARLSAQQVDTVRGFLPKAHLDTTRVTIHLGNWQEGVHPNSPPGVVFRFDYTKFFEWLLPKQKPLIPPDCDPKNMRDWMPDTTKPDSTKIKMPV
jgi:hypothetical protein